MLLSDDVTSETIYAQYKLLHDLEVHYAWCKKSYAFSKVSSMKIRMLELSF
jgi:hypothetical protein